MKKVLILEDNFSVAKQIESLTNEVDLGVMTFVYSQVADGYQCALENTIDLFIIDIILDTKRPGDSSGLNFIDHIRKIERYTFTPVIFITSLEDSRLCTYEELHCYRFFEKPFDVREVKKAIEQCLKFSDLRLETRKLYFRKEGIVVLVKPEEIVWVESGRHYAEIHLSSKDSIRIPYLTLKRFLAEVNSSEFVQCSRSMVVNLNYVDNIDFPNGVISLNQGKGKADIGIRFKKMLKEIIQK